MGPICQADRRSRQIGVVALRQLGWVLWAGKWILRISSTLTRSLPFLVSVAVAPLAFTGVGTRTSPILLSRGRRVVASIGCGGTSISGGQSEPRSGEVGELTRQHAGQRLRVGVPEGPPPVVGLTTFALFRRGFACPIAGTTCWSLSTPRGQRNVGHAVAPTQQAQLRLGAPGPGAHRVGVLDDLDQRPSHGANATPSEVLHLRA